jgi:hypothetical protein
MVVNSATRVTNLNADRLDGKQAGAFLPKATYRKFEGTAGTELPSSGSRLANISCDEGDVLLSGGYGSVDAGGRLLRLASRLIPNSGSWCG